MTTSILIQPEARTVIVGVDTHKHVHVAVAIDTRGIRLGDQSFVADSGGYRALITWADTHERIKAFGIEGTGSYGAGLARAVRRAGHRVVEVNRGDRHTRRAIGKSDTVDAESAARSVLAGQATATALSTWPPAGRVTACPATADTGFHPTSSATRCGYIIASRSASETWRTCWPAGVSTSPMRPSGSGVGGSVLSMRADYGADVAGSETPGISTRCSSRSRVASNTCGVPWMRTVTSSTSSCNRDEIGTPRCDSFASC